jgi:hypothetical protein
VDQAFTTLENNILRAKGLNEAQVTALTQAGITSKADLQTVGDAETLCDLVADLTPDVAARVMEWATGRAPAQAAATVAASTGGGKVVLDSADVVYCIHCGAKQPKDYHSGDLCVACGKQAEPILSCYWCSASGPGKFCRACGAEFVPTAELDLAVLLRREGLPKDEIPKKLRTMSPAEKDDLWGRVRKLRG